MSDLAVVELDELRSRMETILTRLDVLFKQVGPLVKEIGDLRAEAHVIYKEFQRRGVLSDQAPATYDGSRTST